MTADLLAVIPARGGSKRIPHKNIKDFNGLPLIAYSIKNAQDSGLFSKVVVSTDDPEIAEVAQKYGAEVPFLRDATLANDFTGTMPVAMDAYQRLNALQSQPFPAMCLIYATAPLLTPYHLQQACKLFTSSHADYLFAGCEFPFPIQRGFYLKADSTPDPVMPECQPMRSQDLPKAYQDAGQFYMYSYRYLEYFLERQKRIAAGENQESIPAIIPDQITRLYEMPRYRVIDIDTMDDWEYALILAQALKLRPNLV